MKLTYPDILPISSHRLEIVQAIKDHHVSVIVGETGSGKSTQIPKMILEALAEREKTDPTITPFKIACTQPRRIAATSIAARIAEESEVELGKEIGYKIRFDDDTTKGTIITICTDGILLQELKGDPLLSAYDAVLVDEAHERNLNIDFLLGLLKNIQTKRLEKGLKALKIVVTSATVDASKFVRFFEDPTQGSHGKVSVINVSGRVYPVEIIYKPVERGEFIFDKIAHLVEKILKQKERGDMLIFLPGEQEIFSTIRAIELLRLPKVKCLPLFSRLTMEEQQLIFEPHPRIVHVVVSTNIAETSLTVPGIKYVIDSGLARMTDFDFRTGIGSLDVRKISQSSAIQRSGRAGRIEPGVSYRLYEQEDFEVREKYTKPEIQRSDLASVLLHMILIGIDDVYHFEFIDPPDFDAFKNAYKTLHDLGALDSENNLTELGLKMAHLPLEPKIACMLLAAEKYDCVREVAIIASSLSVKDPFLRPNGYEEEADRAKRYFQRLAFGANKKKVRYVKIRKGRKIILKKVWDQKEDRSFDGHTILASDLLTFLAVWKRVQSIHGLEEKEEYCKENYLNFKTLQEIEQIYEQLLDTLKQFGGEEFSKYFNKPQTDLPVIEKDDLHDLNFGEKAEAILKAITSGLIQNLCERSSGITYRSKGADHIFIHPSSMIFSRKPQWFVSAEIIETTKLYARNNTEINPLWFEEVAPHLCTYKYGPMSLDKKTGQIMRREDVLFKGHRIIEDRLNPVREDQRYSAFEFFIREGLVKKVLAYKFSFIHHNDRIIERLRSYGVKSGNRRFFLEERDIFDWYIEACAKAKMKPTSSFELSRMLQKKGDEILKMELDDFVDSKERGRLEELYPDFVYINGKKFEVRYFFNHYKYPNGPAISLSILDLHDLTQEKIKKIAPQNIDFKPFLMICTGEDFVSPVAMDFDVEKLKNEYDQWYLRKAWKLVRRKTEVTNIRDLEEARRQLSKVLEKVEIGQSLFFGTGEEAKIYGYTGLKFESRKFGLMLFENWATAYKSTLSVLRQMFNMEAHSALKFSEEDIKRLERKYQKYFFGMDISSRLIEILWKKIELDKEFAEFERIKDLQYVFKVFTKKKKDLVELKQKIINKFEKILDQIDHIHEDDRSADTEKLRSLKVMLEQDELF